MAEQSRQYEAASKVPLIKSPSLRVPKQVELPPDIHPLPDSVTPYFVYPFTLEPHIITLESSRRSTLAAHAARREAYLRARADETARRRRDALRKIAPGFEPLGAPLVPVKTAAAAAAAATAGTTAHILDAVDALSERPRDVMDEMVDQLAALDSIGSSLS